MLSARKILTILTFLLLVFVAFASFQGAFNPKTFEKDSLSFGTQGIGQDFVNLFFVVPLLFISFLLFRKGNKTGSYLFGGTLFYILYSYMIYAFGVNFNHLFLVYCFILGLSLYTFILFLVDFSKDDIATNLTGDFNPMPMGIFMILIATLFYALWLKDIILALFNQSVPSTVVDNNLLVNPVHVLDISIALPGVLIAAILFLKRQKLGYILAPILLVFIIILTIALIGMVVALKLRNVSEDVSLIYIFGLISIVSVGLLGNFFVKIVK